MKINTDIFYTRGVDVMAAIKGFFFDLDGTLVDTHESNFRAYRQAVQEIMKLDLGEELKTLIKAGESSDSFLRKLIPGLSLEEIHKINEEKKRLYPQHLHVSEVNTYLSNFLEQMSEHSITALVTTAKRKNAEAVLVQHDLARFFTFMIFGDDVKNMKPDPDAYILALDKSGLSHDEVIAFEDSQKGIDAAHAANISTIHIRNFL